MTATKIVMRGQRGESFADVGRRVGSVSGVDIPSDATDGEVLSAIAAAAGTEFGNSLGEQPNILIGAEAGDSIDGATGAIMIGDTAGRDSEAPNDLVMIGRAAGRGNVTGEGLTYLGTAAGLTATGADHCVGVGYEALGYGASGDGRTAVGYRAGNKIASNGVVAIGNLALHEIETAANATAVGEAAGTANGTASNCVFVGNSAGGSGTSHVPANNQIVIGFQAYGTQDSQVALGNDDVDWLKVGLADTYIVVRPGESDANHYFGNAGNRDADNQACVAVGEGALGSAQEVENATAVGNLALSSHTGVGVGGAGCTAIGSRAMRDSVDCTDTTMVGNRAGASMTTGVGSTGVGFRVLEFAAQSRSATAVGDSAGWRYDGIGGTFIGYCAGEYQTAGFQTVGVGNSVLQNRADGDYCVFVGAEAGGFPDATPDPDDGSGAISAGDRVVGVGYRALKQTTGDDHVAVGDQAGAALTGGSGSIFIGSGSGNGVSQKVDAVNSIAIGEDTDTTADNQIVLGNSSITHTALRGKVGIGIGMTAPSANLHVNCTSGGESPLFSRDVDENGMAAVQRIRAVRSVDMGDNVGAATYFVIRDDAAVDNSIGVVGAIRKGADNTGEVQVRPFTGGVLAEGMVVRDRQLIVGWNTPPAAGGTAGVGLCLSSTANLGVFFGSGAPTISAAKGSLYLRSDGSGTNNRMYVNTDGGTTWTAVVTVA